MTEKKKPTEPVSLSGRTVAGRYRVVGLIGQGGIGKVYEAEQIGLDRTVAVKVIRPDRRDDAVTTQRFLREARAAGRISSPHVVTLYDCGTDDESGELYIAMERLEGQCLSARLAEGEPLGVLHVLKTAAMIARGLRAAHEAGVLHRDLKPANVFLCDDGNVKVLDFGIAKLLDDSSEGEPLTQVNRILGTPVYMSPEAATRRPLGPTTDLYALGLLIYEMIVGAPPFKTGDAWKTLEAHVKTEPPRLSAAAPWHAIPPALDALVARLLAKQPQDRPRDAGEVAALLDRMATELALVEASVHDATQVEVRVPLPKRAPEPPTPPTPMTPPTPPALSDSDEVHGLEPTTMWIGGESGRHAAAAAPPDGPTDIELPKVDPAPREPFAATASQRIGGLGVRQLAIAAIVAGAIAFVAALVLRLVL